MVVRCSPSAAEDPVSPAKSATEGVPARRRSGWSWPRSPASGRELAAFFGRLYYAALRPEEAVTLRRADLILRARGRGKIILTAACPRTGSAWTNTGTSHGPTGLKHRPDGTIRVVPIPPVLVSMVRRHLGDHGTTTDGRLFRGARGGVLSESVYGRTWHAARRAVLGPDLAATALARRQRIEDALDAGTGITHSSPRAKASGCTHRRHLPRPCPLTCIAR